MCLAFCEMVLYVFCPFLSIILFALFLQIYSSSLYILDTNPLLIVCVANTFFSICNLSFSYCVCKIHVGTFSTYFDTSPHLTLLTIPRTKPTWHSLVLYCLTYWHLFPWFQGTIYSTCVSVPVADEYPQGTWLDFNRGLLRPKIVTSKKYFWAGRPPPFISYLSTPTALWGAEICLGFTSYRTLLKYNSPGSFHFSPSSKAPTSW